MSHVKHYQSLALVLTLLAAGTGLLWPKINIAAEDTIEPIPVRTLSYRSPMEAIEDAPAYPAWTVRDGLWVPWTMQPPAWWTAIASGPVMAEAVPLPPERPKDKTTPQKGEGEILSFPKRDECARHNLKKTYVTKWRWRCLP